MGHLPEVFHVGFKAVVVYRCAEFLVCHIVLADEFLEQFWESRFLVLPVSAFVTLLTEHVVMNVRSSSLNVMGEVCNLFPVCCWRQVLRALERPWARGQTPALPVGWPCFPGPSAPLLGSPP